jgi:hypothetical protein
MINTCLSNVMVMNNQLCLTGKMHTWQVCKIYADFAAKNTKTEKLVAGIWMPSNLDGQVLSKSSL